MSEKNRRNEYLRVKQEITKGNKTIQMPENLMKEFGSNKIKIPTKPDKPVK